MQFRNQGEPMAPAYFRNVSGLLLAFVVLSALAHGLSLLFSADPVTPLDERRFGASIISTVLSPAKDKPAATVSRKTFSAPQPEKQINKNQALTKTPEIISTAKASNISVRNKTETTSNTDSEKKPLKPQSEPSTKPLSKPVTTAEASTDTTTLTNEAATHQLKQQRNYLLGKVQNRLNRYLTYPVRARKRGWQGEVLVAFHVDALGQLNNVRLAQSSGYSLLDHSALNAIRKLKNVSLPDTLGRLQAMDLKLPVRYQLHES